MQAPGRYPAHYSAEFGLSSLPPRSLGKPSVRGTERPSGPAVNLLIIRRRATAPDAGISAGMGTGSGRHVIHAKGLMSGEGIAGTVSSFKFREFVLGLHQ
jgi:hypothetical protein